MESEIVHLGFEGRVEMALDGTNVSSQVTREEAERLELRPGATGLRPGEQRARLRLGGYAGAWSVLLHLCEAAGAHEDALPFEQLKAFGFPLRQLRLETLAFREGEFDAGPRTLGGRPSRRSPLRTSRSAGARPRGHGVECKLRRKRVTGPTNVMTNSVAGCS